MMDTAPGLDEPVVNTVGIDWDSIRPRKINMDAGNQNFQVSNYDRSRNTFQEQCSCQ